MSLQDQLMTDLKTAMKAKDKLKTEVLRGLKSAWKYAEIDADGAFDDAARLKVIQKQMKQRKDAFEQYTQAGRQDLADKEQGEMDILMAYLPAQLSEDDVRQQVAKVIADLGVSSPKDMGKVMKQVMADLHGQADGKLVSKIARELLTA